MINKLHAEMIKLYAGDPKRIQHFCKVHSYAKLIAEMENVDKKTRFILETAALTHDIGIHICEQKYGDCGGKLRNRKVRDWRNNCLPSCGSRRMYRPEYNI